MKTGSSLPGLRGRRLWPRPAPCAFVASILEILSFAVYMLQRYRSIESAGKTPAFPGELTYLSLALAVALLGLTVQATALWGVGQRQKAVAPVSSRCGQWAIAAYVLVSGLLFAIGTFGLWPAGTVGSWLFQVAAAIPLTLAFGCLGWASRGGTSPKQRWASRSLLVVSGVGVFRVLWTLSGLPTGQRWLWLAALHAALRSAMWAAVGAWLRRAPLTPTLFS